MLPKGGIINDIRKLPKEVLLAVFSISVYRLGWAAGDAYFSIYIESIVNNYAFVGILTGLVTFVAGLLTIPVGVLCDHVRRASIIHFGKMIYPLVALAYLFAGIAHSTPILILAIILHGAAIPFVWTGIESYIRTRSTQKDSARAFGLFDSGRILWIAGLLLATLIIDDIPLYLIFMPVIAFSLISGLITKNLPSRKTKPSFAKIVAQIRKHHHYLKEVLKDIATFNGEMHTAMMLTLFTRFVGALGGLFIPLYAISHNLPLSKVGLLMALIHAPAIFSFLSAELADRSEKITTIISGVVVIGLSALGLYMWQNKTWAMFAFSLIMMVGQTMITPSIYGIITNLSFKRYDGLNTALQNIMQRFGQSFAAIIIGVIANAFGIEFNFFLLALLSLVLVFVLILLRLRWKLKNKLYQMNHPKEYHAPYSL